MAATKKKRLGDLLVEEGLIDRYQLQAALAEQRKWGGRLGKHFIDLGILSEDVLIKALSKLLQLPSVDVGRLTIPRTVVDYVAVKTAERFNLIPINVIEPNPDGGGPTRRTLVVAMSDPTNLAALDEVKFTSGCDVRAVVSGDGAIERAIKVYYHGIVPEEPKERSRPGSDDMPDGDHWEIVTSGEIRTLSTTDPPLPDPTPTPAVLPAQQPEEIASIGQAALQPIASGDDPAELTRRLNALMRLLIKKKVLSPEELEDELDKG